MRTAPVRVQVAEAGAVRILSLELEEYVAGCVAAELGTPRVTGDRGARIFEVQALVCRTNATINRGRHAREEFDLCSGTHCQLYRAVEAATGTTARRARAAAFATRGRIITFANRPIQALFHSNCGGHTSAAESVWGGSEPYLRPRSDRYCRRLPGTTWTFSQTAGRLRTALTRQAETRIEGALRDVRVIERDEAGRAVSVELVGDRVVRVRGAAFRWALLQAFGAASLKSTRFDVVRTTDGFAFRGEGNGHGVGLCQLGAIERARSGQSVETIIGHYYPGVRIQP